MSNSAPGEVMLSVGLKNAQDAMMYDNFSRQKTDSPFPDPEYRIDTILNVEQIGIRMRVVDEVFNDIIFAFNAGAIPL